MKRYFPPLYPMPYTKDQYKSILAAGNVFNERKTWAEFLYSCQKSVRKVGSDEEYGSPEKGHASWFIKKMINNLTRMGTIDKSKDNEKEYVKIYPTGIEFLRNNLSFAEFIWYSIKRGWVLQANLPEGIEALKRILRVVKNANKSLRMYEIKNELKGYYRFNPKRNDLREFIRLLYFMDAIKEIDDSPKTYSTDSNADRIEKRLTDCDIFEKLEDLLRREGANTDILSDKAKRDFAKYYMYRESGGWGKQSRWFKSFWKEYLDLEKTKKQIKKDKPRLFKSKKFTNKTERKKIRDGIKKKFPDIEKSDLRNLTTESLKKIRDAENSPVAHTILSADKSKMSRVNLNKMREGVESYSFSSDFKLWKWQKEAAGKWFNGVEEKNHNPKTGIAQVVTGAGKTIMALEVIRRWRKQNPDGIITILVPSKVLMYQWLRELASKLHVPIEDIGWLGDGKKDKFSDGYKIIVSIVNSAVKNDFLKQDIERVDNPPHLFIADECHRYTGDVFQRIFECYRTASLGLSATPVDPRYRDEEDNRYDRTDDEIVLKELGSIFYELTYKEARKMKIIPEFEIHYVGVDLSKKERRMYDKLTKELGEVLKKIEVIYGNWLWKLDGNFDQKLKHISNREDDPHPSISKYFVLVQQRRRIVDEAVARQAVSYYLLREEILNNERKGIVFQERIRELENLINPFIGRQKGINPRTGERSEGLNPRRDLYEMHKGLKEIDQKMEKLFSKGNYKPVMYHTGHSKDIWNRFAIEWFSEDGFANLMLSVKALVEGIDVPSADMGLIRVSTSSLRQRIQTLGRILRNPEDTEKKSHLYIIYARNTVDERLFKEFDWGEQLGNADIRYEIWDSVEGDPTIGELREAHSDERPDISKYEVDKETVVDVSDLEPGDKYPGRYKGYKISVDSEGRPFEKTSSGRKYIKNPDIKKIGELVYRLKGGGKVAINNKGHVLTLVKSDVIFLGTTNPDLNFRYEEETDSLLSSDEDITFEDVFGS